jgi:hypothetical protein
MPLDQITGLNEPDSHGFYESEVVGKHSHPAEAEDNTVGDGSYSELQSKFHVDFSSALTGKNTMQVVEEMFDWFADHGLLVGRMRSGTHSESKWLALATKLLKFAYYVTEQRKLKGHTTPAVTTYAALHAWDIPEFDAVNGNLNMAEFARTIISRYTVVKGKRKPIYLTKAAVNNAVLDAQRHFQLPPRRDQRNEKSKDSMSETRKSQLRAA